ncbi:MAG: hypothetical protein JXR94_07745, partial [Candidatus Hydrogenedentes bacterium]|nr:hypothetical protein [Candidatus Hydrogenedentota bacterium]
NGLVDTYFRPKPAISPEEVSRFNADTVLLQDGLEIAYRAGDTLSVTLLVSNYAETALNGSTLTWRVRSGGVLLAEGEERPGSVGQGEVVKLSALELLLLPVTTPQQIEIDAELAADGRRYVNNWTAWVFPSSAAPAVSRPVFASGEVWPVAASCAAAPLPGEGELDASAVYLSSLLSGRILDAVERGACLVMLRPTGIFPSAITRWKTAWWHGDERDNNAGTVAYDHPVTRALAPDGWCDAGWYRMIENADGYLLDALPARPDVAIRGIEVASVCRDKALLFEASVGAGSILVSGLHLDAPQEHPEMAWILRRLVEYAATLPKPAAAFPASYLRERAADVPQFDGPFFEGFARLIRNEGEESEWFTYRETSAPGHICRQTQPGNAVEWDTAPVPAGFDGAAATFVFAGGLGWQSEPETDGFCLSVNGTDVFELDVVGNLTTWRNDELGAALALFPCHATAEDTAGLFYLRLPAALLTPGQPCRIAVRSRGTGSHRWFSLHPYTDVIARPAP